MAYSQTKLYYPPDACEAASRLFLAAYNINPGTENIPYPKGRFRISPGLQVIVGSSMQGKSQIASLWVERLFRPAAEADQLDVAYARAGDADTGCLGSEVAEVLLASLLTKRPVSTVADEYQLAERHRQALADAVDVESWERSNKPGSIYVMDSIRDASRWERLARDIGAASILETVTTSASKTHVDTHTKSVSSGASEAIMTPGIKSTTETRTTSQGKSQGESTGGVTESYSYDLQTNPGVPSRHSVSKGIAPGTSQSKSTTESKSVATTTQKGTNVTSTTTSGGSEADTTGLNATEGQSVSVRHALDRTGQPGGLSQGFIDLLIRIDLYARQLGIYLVVVANPLLSDSVGLRNTFSGTCSGAFNVGDVQPVRTFRDDTQGYPVDSRLRYYLDPSDPVNIGSDCSNSRSFRLPSGSHITNPRLHLDEESGDSGSEILTDTSILEG